MFKKDTIDKDTLKVGDVVAVKIPTRIGWTYFRYPSIAKKTIARITPARTKFIMTDGTDYNKQEPFYTITDELLQQDKVARKATLMSQLINAFDDLKKDGKLFNQSDEVICMAADKLKEAYDAVVK